jgi:hypothetical protein
MPVCRDTDMPVLFIKSIVFEVLVTMASVLDEYYHYLLHFLQLHGWKTLIAVVILYYMYNRVWVPLVVKLTAGFERRRAEIHNSYIQKVRKNQQAKSS